MNNGVTATQLEVRPSGRTYSPRDKTIDSRDLNFAVQSGLVNNRHNNIYAKPNHSLANWESSVHGDGILLKFGTASSLNGGLEQFGETELVPVDDWTSGDTNLAYIPFNADWFNTTNPAGNDVEGTKESIYLVLYAHAVEGDVPALEFPKADEILKNYLSLKPDKITLSVTREDDESFIIPQCDCLANRVSKKLCRFRLSRVINATKMFVISIDNYLVGQHLTFDCTLEPLQLVNIESSPSLIARIYMPTNNSWTVRNTIGNRDIISPEWQGTEDPLPANSTYGTIPTVHGFQLNNSMATQIIYFRINGGIRKPKSVQFVNIGPSTVGLGTSSDIFYKLYMINMQTVYGTNRRVSIFRKYTQDIIYYPIPLTFNASGAEELPIFNTPGVLSSQDTYKYVRMVGFNNSNRGTLILDYIRAAASPLEIVEPQPTIPEDEPDPPPEP